MPRPTHGHGSRPLKDADWLNAPQMQRIFTVFEKAGSEIRAVGGAVRNTLLHQPVSDIDLATPALPADVMRFCAEAGFGVHPTGIEHGTVTVVADGHPVEVTTLRRDVETDGRRAVVAFTRNWNEDAWRRDFTINAIYADADGSLFDPTGGLADLKAKRVRFIGRPENRIREDYLRILRFFRFSAAYGEGALDQDGLAAATALKAGIKTLSGERTGAEMLKLVVAAHAGTVAGAMQHSGILSEVFGCDCHPERLARLVRIEAYAARTPDTVVRLAALVLEGAQEDGQAARAIAEKLRLSNIDAAALAAATVSDKAFDPVTAEDVARRHLYRIGAKTWDRAALVAWARSDAATDDAARQHRLDLPQYWPVPVLPLRGADIIARGIAPGPEVGKILAAFEEWWISADFPGDSAMQQMKLQALIQRS